MVLKRVTVMAMVLIMVMVCIPVAVAEEGAKLDLNTASVDDLIQLKGIGQKYAQRIIEYRETNGPFTQIEEITKIKGIGAKTFESIKDLITVKTSE